MHTDMKEILAEASFGFESERSRNENKIQHLVKNKKPAYMCSCLMKDKTFQYWTYTTTWNALSTIMLISVPLSVKKML